MGGHVTTRLRRLVFLAGAILGLALLLPALGELPAVGAGTSAYADLLDRITPDERHVADVITAINFDFRGLDTLGEEMILFAAVLGVAMLLRHHLDEAIEGFDEAAGKTSSGPRPSEAMSVLAIGLVGVTILFGLYVVAHGQLTPGGGFQGGVILASAPLVAYLTGGASVFRRLASPRYVRGVEAVGAGGYVCTGLLGLFAGAPFLANVLPLGTMGDLFSGGTILVLDALTGMAVAGGFVVLVFTFVEELGERARGAS